MEAVLTLTPLSTQLVPVVEAVLTLTLTPLSTQLVPVVEAVLTLTPLSTQLVPVVITGSGSSILTMLKLLSSHV